jgi:N-acetylmuramoyl-L-alanine amidase
VLIELGFISNPDEEKYLNSTEGQDYLASAIFRAFRDYRQTIDSRSGIKNGNSVRETDVPDAGAGGRSDTTVKPPAEASKKDSTPPPASETTRVVEVKPAVTTAGNQGLAPSAGADDIYFMVQISAMPRNREMDHRLLRDIETVTKIEDGERIKYAAGKFSVYDDAIKYRRTLVLRFPDAFVIAVRNGKAMPLREAIEAKKQK